MSELLVMVCLITGGVFAAVAGIGLLKLPDILLRMHASTKAGTLGVGLIVLALAIHLGTAYDTTRSLLIIGFLLLTAPVGAHLIGRAAYRTGTPLWYKTVIDDHEIYRCEPTASRRHEATVAAGGDLISGPPVTSGGDAGGDVEGGTGNAN